MSFCAMCGAPLPSSGKFCVGCGREFSPITSPANSEQVETKSSRSSTQTISGSSVDHPQPIKGKIEVLGKPIDVSTISNRVLSSKKKLLAIALAIFLTLFLVFSVFGSSGEGPFPASVVSHMQFLCGQPGTEYLTGPRGSYGDWYGYHGETAQLQCNPFSNNYTDFAYAFDNYFDLQTFLQDPNLVTVDGSPSIVYNPNTLWAVTCGDCYAWAKATGGIIQ
jgi:hypothetical protein